MGFFLESYHDRALDERVLQATLPFFTHAILLDRAFAHCLRFPTAAPVGVQAVSQSQCAIDRSALAKDEGGKRSELHRYSRGEVETRVQAALALPEKEVIQQHLPVRLPCYDFTLSHYSFSFCTCLVEVEDVALVRKYFQQVANRLLPNRAFYASLASFPPSPTMTQQSFP
ncbi:hypothetical protein KY290_024502 [Solanum tuberosum]|uniref:Uncharacterized protein n=1 Tax=Solanum tuberosum TaxID=4113 RepID=A0ABQ7UQW5_SOLTU|nr:hypothetical protein KY290_024502 [Solanum tuberosum]